MFVGIWDLAEKKLVSPIAKGTSTIYTTHLINDELLAVGQRNGQIFFLDIPSKETLKNFQLTSEDVFSITSCKNQWLAATKSGELIIGDIPTLSIKEIFPLSTKSLRCLAITPNEKELAVGSSDHSIYIIDIERKKITYKISGSKNSVFTLGFLSEDILLSGGRDAHLHIWKRGKNSEWKLKQSIPAHNFTINKIVYNKKKQLFATASRDKTIKLWDAENYELLKVIERRKFNDGHTHSVNTLLWFQDYLISAGDDKKLFVWKIED